MMKLARFFAFLGSLLLGSAVIACPVDVPHGGQTAAYVVVDCIDGAKQRVWLAAEVLTHPEINEALGKAKLRMVDVQVIMRTPPSAPRYSSATFLFNKQVPVYVHDAGTTIDPNFMVIDDRFVGTFDEQSATRRLWRRETMGSSKPGSQMIGQPLRLIDDPASNGKFADTFDVLRAAATEFKPAGR
ncbi:exported hypothetical protein [Burkholderiales bacterium 8X]|nr:exported hypothetical protein [Burkholderiales bacterium 8X]